MKNNYNDHTEDENKFASSPSEESAPDNETPDNTDIIFEEIDYSNLLVDVHEDTYGPPTDWQDPDLFPSIEEILDDESLTLRVDDNLPDDSEPTPK